MFDYNFAPFNGGCRFNILGNDGDRYDVVVLPDHCVVAKPGEPAEVLLLSAEAREESIQVRLVNAIRAMPPQFICQDCLLEAIEWAFHKLDA